MAGHPPAPVQGKRRRRAHQKSRRGCGNCKLRRVKCDETQPQCKKCIAYCVSCDYDTTLDELQMTRNGTFVFEAPAASSLSSTKTILSMINRPNKKGIPIPSFYELRPKDLETLSRFGSRTVLTIGTKETVHIYQREWFKIACEQSMLMHIALAMTLMHDRYLSGFANTPQSVTEAYHWYQGTVMFNRKLTKHESYEKDALWAATALLGALSIANIDAETYDEAWPLKAPSESDLGWLRMSEGKRAVWKLVDPMREGSVIREAWQLLGSSQNTKTAGLASCPTFDELSGLRELTIGEDNPCHNAASLLMPLLAKECNHSTIVEFLSFVGHPEPAYMQLLEEKDPLALLTMAYWYAKMSQYKQWWIQPRALLECQAICVYLEKYHHHDEKIQSLLHFPKVMTGIAYE